MIYVHKNVTEVGVCINLDILLSLRVRLLCYQENDEKIS